MPGEEPDGVWWNPSGLFGLADGGKVDSRDFFRLYDGMAPDGSGKLTRNAGSAKRSPGLDLGFNADKTVSALWAIADADLRADVERAHGDAARTALGEVIRKYCGVTRIRDRKGKLLVLSADILAALFQQGASREGDPQLCTHCVIINVTRTCRDGRCRSLYQKPAYYWTMTAGAAYRNALAWNLHTRLGIRMEQYGPDGAFTRVVGMPEALVAHWSKRFQPPKRSWSRRAESPGGMNLFHDHLDVKVNIADFPTRTSEMVVQAHNGTGARSFLQRSGTVPGLDSSNNSQVLANGLRCST